MVSIKMIAEQCNVSTATVSKALNGHQDISEQTKKKIKKVAEEMGYFPNSAARALKTKRSYNIGVLFEEEAGSGLTHEYFSGVLNGLKDQVEEQGYDLTFINSCFENKKMSYLDHARYRNFDGIVVVCCADFETPGIQALINSEIPVVTVDYVHQNCTSVLSNNVKGMEDLIRYIYKNGHKKIAYIHGQNNSFVTRMRLAAFYRTVEELGLQIPDTYVRESKYLDTIEAEKNTKALLNLSDPPTCILYPDDISLIGGENIITAMGMRIPGDISIAGYDGIKMSQLLSPKITTIQQNTAEVGRESARKLITMIEKPKTSIPESIVIEGILIPGQSVGKVPDRSQ